MFNKCIVLQFHSVGRPLKMSQVEGLENEKTAKD